MPKNNNSNDETFFLNLTVQSNFLRYSKIKHTPSICIKFFCDEDQQTYYHDMYLTPAAIEKTVKQLRNVFDSDPDRIEELNEPFFKGFKCSALCTKEEYQGNFSTKILKLYKPSQKSLSADEIDALSSSVNPLLNKLKNIQNKGADSTIDEPELPDLNFPPSPGSI